MEIIYGKNVMTVYNYSLEVTSKVLKDMKEYIQNEAVEGEFVPDITEGMVKAAVEEKVLPSDIKILCRNRSFVEPNTDYVRITDLIQEWITDHTNEFDYFNDYDEDIIEDYWVND